MNLIKGLQSEMNRVRGIITEYEAIPAGRFAAAIMKLAIKQAEETIATGDTIAMMSAYKSLTEFELWTLSSLSRNFKNYNATSQHLNAKAVNIVNGGLVVDLSSSIAEHARVK